MVQVVTGYLRRADFNPVVASDGVTGLELARQMKPDLVVLDVMLPGLDGIQFCRELRTDSEVPVIMLTSSSDEQDRLRGLAVGADDYLVKPFSPRELVLRVRSVLRRTTATPPAPGGVLSAGDLVVDQAARVVSKAGRELTLTNKEFERGAYLSIDDPRPGFDDPGAAEDLKSPRDRSGRKRFPREQSLAWSWRGHHPNT